MGKIALIAFFCSIVWNFLRESYKKFEWKRKCPGDF